MPEQSHIHVLVNGSAVSVASGSTVTVAIMQAGAPCRISVTGEPRSALCGMGICYECRAFVDSVPHQRTCLLLCREGMSIETLR